MTRRAPWRSLWPAAAARRLGRRGRRHATRSASSARRRSIPFATAVAEQFGSKYESQDPGGREHRHRRRHQAVLRRRRRAAPRHHQRLAPRSRSPSRGLRQATASTEITEVKIGFDGIVLANSKRRRADARDHSRRSGWRSPRKCRSTASSWPTPTGTGARSTRRCPTRRSRCSARRRPPARATRSSSW